MPVARCPCDARGVSGGITKGETDPLFVQVFFCHGLDPSSILSIGVSFDITEKLFSVCHGSLPLLFLFDSIIPLVTRCQYLTPTIFDYPGSTTGCSVQCSPSPYRWDAYFWPQNECAKSYARLSTLLDLKLRHYPISLSMHRVNVFGMIDFENSAHRKKMETQSEAKVSACPSRGSARA